MDDAALGGLQPFVSPRGQSSVQIVAQSLPRQAPAY